MIEITDKYDCCGCTACESVCGHDAIAMVADIEGFLYPKVDVSKCVGCGLCERVCPVKYRDTNRFNSLPQKVYALHHVDNDVWQTSSSGGVFAALVEDCLSQGGIVFGAEYDDDFVVVHKGEETHDGVLKFRGSKYVQSDMRGVFRDVKQYLREGRHVLFSGTPCQVEGLKCFLLKPYDNLITVDILCHGVPSPRVFADYVKYISRHSFSILIGINMKDKTFGWGYQNLRLFFKGGYSEFNSPLSNLWNRIFYGHVANRPACHKCRFTNLSRPGDLTIGDFWGIEKSHPEFISDKGISLLLVNSDNGMRIWNRVQSRFVYMESDTAECQQPAVYCSQPEAVDRVDFWSRYLSNGFNNIIHYKYGISIISLASYRLRQFVSMIKRTLNKIKNL